MVNFKSMLPGEARETLHSMLLDKLERAKLNYLANPTYDYVDALKDFREELDSSEWLSGTFRKCWESAVEEYNKKHPKRWDNEKQSAYRL